jgi:hypothetical protein
MLLRKKKQVMYLFCKRKIKINNTFNLSFQLINIKKRLVFLIKTNDNFLKYKYIVLPPLFKIRIKNNIIYLNFLNKKKLHNLYSIFIHFINKTKVFYKQIILKGSGFKVVFFSKLNQLECKLGFTHKKYILLPAFNQLEVIFQKPVLVVLDYNINRLGNFIKTLKNLRTFNAYTGRGFWELKKQQKLKLIKKQ